MKPQLSVIIPIYNVENYLSECIKSVLNQSFKNFELILVNDGSTDNSLQICKHYQELDTRIRVFDKSNGGVSKARNTGLEESDGEWVCFIDSDDIIEVNYLNDLFCNVENVDFAMCGITIVDLETKNEKIIKPLRSNKFLINEINLLDTVPLLLLASPISKLFKKEIISKFEIKFDERISIGEDYLFVLNYLNNIKMILLLNNSNYIYYRRRGSLSTSYNELECEILAENELYRTTLEVFLKLGYDTALIEKFYKSEFKKHAYRILFSLYKNNKKSYTKQDRINLIKKIDTIQKNRLIKMFHTMGFKGCIITFLLRFIPVTDYILMSIINNKLK